MSVLIVSSQSMSKCSAEQYRLMANVYRTMITALLNFENWLRIDYKYMRM